MIFAMSPERVIGVSGRIPWNHPADQKRFMRVTAGSTVIMGRATFDSVGKALPKRRNVVVTRTPVDVPDVECVRSIDEALALAGAADVWFIGGARIYEEAMRHVDVIDVTYVPDHVDAPGAVRAPDIDERVFEPGPLVPLQEEPAVMHRRYTRRAPS
jgi:dihydrofolate reductase